MIQDQVKTQQKGAGLVEMMVVMVLGLVMLGGTGSLYVNFKEAFQVQKSQANFLDSFRYSGTLISGILRQAGYASIMVNGTLLNDKSDVFVINGNFTASNQVVFGEQDTVTNVVQYLENGSTQTIASLPSDSVSIRFMGGTEIFRCLGSSADLDGAQYRATFKVNNNFQLECEDEIIAGAPLESITDILVGENSGNITSQLRVLGLAAWYGEDNSGNGSVDRYRRANAVSDWRRVKSVTLRLTVQSGNMQPRNLNYVVHLPNAPVEV